MSGGRWPGIGIPRAGVDLDPDAVSWIARVELADGQLLETAFQQAVSDLVAYAKATASVNGGTLWSRIYCWTLLSGPRTVAGAMVIPLKGGVQPVGVNLTAGLHTRNGGIVGTATLRIETGVSLPEGLPVAGGVYQTEVPATVGGTYWNDSFSFPPPYMLGMGGGGAVTPADSAFFTRAGAPGTTLVLGTFGNTPFAPHAMEHVGSAAFERTSSAEATTSWDIARNTSLLTAKGQSPGPAATTRGPVDLFSRRSGSPFPGLFRLGGFIQGSLSALECNDLLNRYQAEVATHIP